MHDALSPKEIRLIELALSATVTSVDDAAVRRHVRAALRAAATADEIREVLSMAALLDFSSITPAVDACRFIAAGAGIYSGGMLTLRFVQLLSAAFDASVAQRFATGSRRHVKRADAFARSLAILAEEVEDAKAPPPQVPD